MITSGLSNYRGRNVLMLQGPLGPFFNRLATDLKLTGAKVTKVNFNGGDFLFAPGGINFKGSLETWPYFLKIILAAYNIDLILLFGDCRPLHQCAHKLAEELGIEVGVFEEGYVRPNYITLERYGVNAHSQISRDPSVYLGHAESKQLPESEVGNAFWATAIWAILYYLASALMRPAFREYKHHRPLSIREAWPWALGAVRKQYYKFKERGLETLLKTTLSKKYFLVPLQVHNDSQVKVHSNFTTVERFIEETVKSFAENADKDIYLAIKHHPMDRGYHDYSRLIRRLELQHALHGRILYIHDQHLPSLLENALGVVLINSTVGLSSLHHQTPLKVCGEAMYDIPGLTCQSDISMFWRAPADYPVNMALYIKFRNYLVRNTQINGSFYKRINKRATPLASGLIWV